MSDNIAETLLLNSQYFPRWLHMVRTDSHISQRNLGRLIGVTQSTVSDYERGIMLPVPRVMARIANWYDRVQAAKEEEKDL